MGWEVVGRRRRQHQRLAGPSTPPPSRHQKLKRRRRFHQPRDIPARQGRIVQPQRLRRSPLGEIEIRKIDPEHRRVDDGVEIVAAVVVFGDGAPEGEGVVGFSGASGWLSRRDLYGLTAINLSP